MIFLPNLEALREDEQHKGRANHEKILPPLLPEASEAELTWKSSLTAWRSYTKNLWQCGRRRASSRDRALGTSKRLLDRGALSGGKAKTTFRKMVLHRLKNHMGKKKRIHFIWIKVKTKFTNSEIYFLFTYIFKTSTCRGKWSKDIGKQVEFTGSSFHVTGLLTWDQAKFTASNFHRISFRKVTKV